MAHSIFGVAQTINSANYAYFAAQEKLRELDRPKAYEIFTEELLRLHRGQGMDLYWRDSLTCPTEEEYIEMISNKTGGLFRLAIKLMQLESEVVRWDSIYHLSALLELLTGAVISSGLSIFWVSSFRSVTTIRICKVTCIAKTRAFVKTSQKANFLF